MLATKLFPYTKTALFDSFKPCGIDEGSGKYIFPPPAFQNAPRTVIAAQRMVLESVMTALATANMCLSVTVTHAKV